MEVIKGQDDAGNVESCGAVRESLIPSEEGPELPSQAGLHQHVEILGVVVGPVQLDYELTVTVLHYLLLIQDVLLLLAVLDLRE